MLTSSVNHPSVSNRLPPRSPPLHANIGDVRCLPPFAVLRAFEAVFRTGGIRKAAASLDVNHAAVSRHLRALENWLGLSLFEREGNRLSLTKEAAEYHERISAAMAELIAATQDIKSNDKGQFLRLFCVPGLSIQWLSQQLAEFETLHPEYSVELKPTDEPANLLIHEAHADIRYVRDIDDAQHSGIACFELARPDILAVASPAVAAQLSTLRSVHELTIAPLLHEKDQAEWRSWLKLNGVEQPGDLPGPLCWHAHLAIAAARLGRGVALASKFLVADDLQRGDLVEVQVPGARRVPLGSYVLTSRDDRWSSLPLATLRRFLHQRAGERLA